MAFPIRVAIALTQPEWRISTTFCPRQCVGVFSYAFLRLPGFFQSVWLTSGDLSAINNPNFLLAVF